MTPEVGTADFADVFCEYPPGEVVENGLPMPEWERDTPFDIPRLTLSWAGCLPVTVSDSSEEHAMIAVSAQVDALGHIEPGQWTSTLATPRGDEDDYEAHAAPLPGLGERWQQFVDDTFDHVRTATLVEAKITAEEALASGRIGGYSSVDEARVVAGRAGALLHAYAHYAGARARAVRLAAEWTGTEQQFIDTLPSIVG